MSDLRLPNSNLVLERLLGRIFGTEDHSARDLPTDQTKWTDSGFTTYTNLGGPGSGELPKSMVGFTISSWATLGAGNVSRTPPWAKAFDRAMTVYAALQGIEANDFYGAHETRSTGYYPHTVITAWPTSEPMDIPGDPSGFARVDFDIMLQWAAVVAS